MLCCVPTVSEFETRFGRSFGRRKLTSDESEQENRNDLKARRTSRRKLGVVQPPTRPGLAAGEASGRINRRRVRCPLVLRQHQNASGGKVGFELANSRPDHEPVSLSGTVTVIQSGPGPASLRPRGSPWHWAQPRKLPEFCLQDCLVGAARGRPGGLRSAGPNKPPAYHRHGHGHESR